MKPKKQIRILASSDMHGKMVPWLYALDEEDRSGSLAQLASAVKQCRNEHTLLVDAGDVIQDNFADIFIGKPFVHPMIQGMNHLGYNLFVTGNHEYNYGIPVLREVTDSFQGVTLTGNVKDEQGHALWKGSHIFEIDGIRVAMVGMVTPLSAAENIDAFETYEMKYPRDNVETALKEIEGSYDVLIGVFHMGIEDENRVEGTGITELCQKFPQFDVIISAHEHRLINTSIDNILVVQNSAYAASLQKIDLTLEQSDSGWKLIDKKAEPIKIADYEPDPDMIHLLEPYDAMAKEDCHRAIGELKGGTLAPKIEVKGYYPIRFMDTPLSEFINEVMMYYSGATVSATAMFDGNAGIAPGVIRKCDISLIYKYANSLYKVHMNGAQLKKYMEWTVSYFNTFHPGDLTLSFNETFTDYNYDIFSGICYEINLSKDAGNRIENLTWPDGKPVEDHDEFDVAMSHYRAIFQMYAPGVIFEEDDRPSLVEADIRSDIGGVRELIRDYIVKVKHGIVEPHCDHHWQITGIRWDEALHQKAMDQLKQGIIPVPVSDDGKTLFHKPVTVKDLR